MKLFSFGVTKTTICKKVATGSAGPSAARAVDLTLEENAEATGSAGPSDGEKEDVALDEEAKAEAGPSPQPSPLAPVSQEDLHILIQESLSGKHPTLRGLEVVFPERTEIGRGATLKFHDGSVDRESKAWCTMIHEQQTNRLKVIGGRTKGHLEDYLDKIQHTVGVTVVLEGRVAPWSKLCRDQNRERQKIYDQKRKQRNDVNAATGEGGTGKDEQPGTSSRSLFVAGCSKKDRGRNDVFMRIGKTDEAGGRQVFGPAICEHEGWNGGHLAKVVACALALGRKLSIKIELSEQLRKVDVSEEIIKDMDDEAQQWLEKTSAKQRRWLRDYMGIQRIQFVDNSAGYLDGGVEKRSGNGESKSVRLYGPDVGKYRNDIAALTGGFFESVALGGKKVAIKAGLDPKDVEEAGRAFFNDALTVEQVHHLRLVPARTRQIMLRIMKSSREGGTEPSEALQMLQQVFNDDDNKKFLGVSTEFERGKRGKPYAWQVQVGGRSPLIVPNLSAEFTQKRVFMRTCDTLREAIAEREVFLQLFVARFPEAFAKFTPNDVGAYEDGDLTEEEKAIARRVVRELWGDELAEALDELRIIAEDGGVTEESDESDDESDDDESDDDEKKSDESLAQTCPAPPRVPLRPIKRSQTTHSSCEAVSCTAHVRGIMQNALDENSRIPSSSCRIVGTLRAGEESRCVKECGALTYTFLSPLKVTTDEADSSRAVYSTKSGITLASGYHNAMARWASEVEKRLGIPGMRYALLRAASKRDYFDAAEKTPRVEIFHVGSFAHVQELRALDHGAKSANLTNFVKGTTEQYQLGADPTLARKLNAAYATAHSSFLKKVPDATSLCSVEVPRRGTFSRGRWTAEDDANVAKIVAGALIANKDGELEQFKRDLHPFFQPKR